jgi:hypothetical protein
MDQGTFSGFLHSFENHSIQVYYIIIRTNAAYSGGKGAGFTGGP